MSAVCHVRYLSRFLKISCLLFVTSAVCHEIFKKWCHVSAVCHGTSCPLFVTSTVCHKNFKKLCHVSVVCHGTSCPLFVTILSPFCHVFVTFIYQKFVSIRFKTAKTTWGCTRTWTRTKSKSWHKHGHGHKQKSWHGHRYGHEQKPKSWRGKGHVHEHKQKSWHGYCQKIFNYLERIIYVLDKDFYQLLCI